MSDSTGKPLPGVYHDRYYESWVNRSGPGDARPTALQIIKDEDRVGKLGDKVAVITGCSGGIGVETLKALHATGATCFATARKPDVLAEVIKKIQDEDTSNKAPIYPVIIDLESLDSVRKGAAEILEKSGGKVNILLNNAGVMATPWGKTKDGYETQFGTNHISHFLLFQILKPALLAASTPEFNSRVINVSSIGHRYGPVRIGDYNFEKDPEYTPWLGYGQSKTANLWMASEIGRRYGSKGLRGYGLHPGGIWTGLAKHLDEEFIKTWDNPNVQKYMKSPEQGAATQVLAAVGREFEGRSVLWMSNCEEYGPVSDEVAALGAAAPFGEEGYHPHAADEKGAKQLWIDSSKFVGVTED